MSYDLFWSPPIELSLIEQFIVKRTLKKRKLFVFLREVRHELFDEEFQEELTQMYRRTGAGKPPVAPALMAMAVILQKYAGVSDNETIELTVFDKRWQMVLDCLDAEHPPFSVGAFFDFRTRLTATNMDKRLLERTVEFARQKGGFSAKALRATFDSSPFEACGRVEDTVNLLAHAAKKAISVLAKITATNPPNEKRPIHKGAGVWCWAGGDSNPHLMDFTFPLQLSLPGRHEQPVCGLDYPFTVSASSQT